jgi:predicted transcriptional regulator with HTH domain
MCGWSSWSSADTHEEKSINRKHLRLKVFYLLKSVYGEHGEAHK